LQELGSTIGIAHIMYYSSRFLFSLIDPYGKTNSSKLIATQRVFDPSSESLKWWTNRDLCFTWSCQKCKFTVIFNVANV